jgi:hypothetical protein
VFHKSKLGSLSRNGVGIGFEVPLFPDDTKMVVVGNGVSRARVVLSRRSVFGE